MGPQLRYGVRCEPLSVTRISALHSLINPPQATPPHPPPSPACTDTSSSGNPVILFQVARPPFRSQETRPKNIPAPPQAQIHASDEPFSPSHTSRYDINSSRSGAITCPWLCVQVLHALSPSFMPDRPLAMIAEPESLGVLPGPALARPSGIKSSYYISLSFLYCICPPRLIFAFPANPTDCLQFVLRRTWKVTTSLAYCLAQ